MSHSIEGSTEHTMINKGKIEELQQQIDKLKDENIILEQRFEKLKELIERWLKKKN